MDLIPDFIPILGYLDDVLLLTGLIWITIKLLPPEVLAECSGQADDWIRSNGAKPTSRAGAALIVVLWIAIGAALWFAAIFVPLLIRRDLFMSPFGLRLPKPWAS